MSDHNSTIQLSMCFIGTGLDVIVPALRKTKEVTSLIFNLLF